MSPETMGLLYAARNNTKRAEEISQSNKNAQEKSIERQTSVASERGKGAVSQRSLQTLPSN